MKTWSDFGIDINGRGHGPEIKTTCPQCSASRKKSRYACLNVNLDKGVWHCWHCEWSGSLQRGQEQRSAPPRRITYRKPAPPVPSHKPGLEEWFARRSIPLDLVQRSGITLTRAYFPQVEEELDAIAFPYSRDGQLINIKYRALHD